MLCKNKAEGNEISCRVDRYRVLSGSVFETGGEEESFFELRKSSFFGGKEKGGGG